MSAALPCLIAYLVINLICATADQWPDQHLPKEMLPKFCWPRFILNSFIGFPLVIIDQLILYPLNLLKKRFKRKRRGALGSIVIKNG